jgi:hypothetical protein
MSITKTITQKPAILTKQSAFLSHCPITCATSPVHHPPASRYADFSRPGE